MMKIKPLDISDIILLAEKSRYIFHGIVLIDITKIRDMNIEQKQLGIWHKLGHFPIYNFYVSFLAINLSV